MIKTRSASAGLAVPATLMGIGVSFVAVIVMIVLQADLPNQDVFTGTTGPFGSSHELKKFSSYFEMTDFLSDVQAYYVKLYSDAAHREGVQNIIGPSSGLFFMAQQSMDNLESRAQVSADLDDYSGTNVQVAGIDEADFLKNDGKYAYVLSGDRLTIVDAYPPEDAKIESRVILDIDRGQSTQNMFLNGDRLVVFYQGYGRQIISPSAEIDGAYPPTNSYEPRTHMLIIDISDRSNPRTLDNYDVTGQYSSARMIGDKIFLLTVGAVDSTRPSSPTVIDTSSSKLVAEPDVYYFDYPQQNYAFNTITMLDLDQLGSDADGSVLGSPLVSKTFMIGAGTTVYVSDKNVYLAYQEYPDTLPLRKNLVADFVSPEVIRSKTVIHKISIQSGSLFEYVAKGEVPGSLLNQFSMNEQGNRFTVATTSDSSSFRGSVTGNNVYRLDDRMATVGKLEGIAEGESIYAARFVGERLYLVTFRQIDPFFVIDISVDQPRVLGELKIPGFSNYLHPYDNNHVIGIGREGNEEGSQRVKVALFDVSDVIRPKVLDTYGIGGMQTDSEVLRDHKALLFDKGRDILSIPISSYDGYSLDETASQDPLGRENAPWNGFYVFGLSPEKGIELKGTIRHIDRADGGFESSLGGRSFFIKDTLYTLTPGLIKMNDVDDLDIEMNSIRLSGSGEVVTPLAD